jgi:ferredoxin-NADP reductase
VKTFVVRSRASSGAREARVVAITRATADAVTLRLSVGPLTFRAGQFVTLSVPILGRVQRRNYSVSCAEGTASEVNITVKRVPGGAVSTFLTCHAKVGDTFGVLGPHGSFVRPQGHRGPVVLIGAGSGVTPLYSLLLTVLSGSAPADVALLYGNKSRESTIFADELDALEKAHPHLSVLHAREEMGKGPSAARVFAGRMDADVLARMLDSLPLVGQPDVQFFLCGPEPVRRTARELLLGRGVPAARVHEERYTSDEASASTPPQSVVFQTTSGKRVTLALLEGETLLAGAMRAGLSAPFSCTMGGCGDCRMRLILGDVVMEEPNCLLPAERARGEILGCVARAREACVVEVRT